MTGPSARGGSREPGQLLFDELRSLHRRAGEPSTRTLARRLGVGVLSHSTVHTVLTGPRVPRWDPLELVVRQLGGDVERFRYLWLAARGAADAPPAMPVPVYTAEPAPLIGRHPELEAMRDWVADLPGGRGHAVIVEGEPGIGKSAFVRAAANAAANAAAAAGCQVRWAACDELSQAFPLLPLLDCLDADAAGDGRPSIAETLRAAAVPGNGFDVVAAATEQLLAVVDRLCVSAPVMLVVDDLQWADPATVAALGRLVRSVAHLPLLVAVTARPVPRREDLNALRRAIGPAGLLALRGLADAEVVELVGRAAGGVPGQRLLGLAEGAGGNPLYLTELVAALARGGALRRDGGRVEATDTRIPDSLSAAIADRLLGLSEPARDVLRIAALLGTDFAVPELAMLSARSVNDLLAILDEAIDSGVLLGNGTELTFRHPLIRAALYDGMPPAIRAAWHRETAQRLAEHGAQPDRVARQLLPALDSGGLDSGGSVDPWVVRWLADHGQQLVGQAPHAAIRLLRWAMSGTPAGPTRELLVCRLAEALYRAGDPAGADEVAGPALAQATSPDAVVDLHGILSRCRSLEGRSAEALSAVQRALDAPDLRPGDRARLLVVSARMQFSLGRMRAAGEVARQALAFATAAADRWAAGWALYVLGLAHGASGELAEAMPLFDRALAVTQGDPALSDLRLLLQLNRAHALGGLDHQGEAIVAAQQARDEAGSIGNVARLALAQAMLNELLFDVGRWDDTLAEITHARGQYTYPFVECVNHGIAAVIHLHRGDDAAAHHHLTEASRAATRLPGRTIGPFLLALSLEREHANAPADALAALTTALATEEMEEALELLADAVRLAVAIGDLDTANTLVGRAESMTRASDLPHRQAIAAHCRGLIEHDPTALLRAANLYQTTGRRLPQAQALEAAGVALAASGDTAGAGTQFTSALSVYTDLSADWDLTRVHAALHTPP